MHKRTYLLLVLKAMAAALHVHLLGVGVVELAVAELAVEGERLAVVAADLLDVVLAHGLHLGLGLGLGVLVVVACGARARQHRTEPPRRHERDLGRARYRAFSYQIKRQILSISLRGANCNGYFTTLCDCLRRRKLNLD